MRKIIGIVVIGVAVMSFAGCRKKCNTIGVKRCNGTELQVCNAEKKWMPVQECNKLGATCGEMNGVKTCVTVETRVNGETQKGKK